jgi:LysR family hydrogen peroxide-inducible transcriptional activator
MNFQQLEYIVAVKETRQFAKAAARCFITQPTLSMMVQKLEDELGVKIFERNRQSIVPTAEGELIIESAKKILAEAQTLRNISKELKEDISGSITIGIIPTLAPYLLPLFLKGFLQKHPLLKIRIKELVTEEIIRQLNSRQLDIGLLAGPLNEANLAEHHLFYEEFFAYASRAENIYKKKYLAPRNINAENLWLLEEGHCFRNQVLNFCELKKKEDTTDNLSYEAGSIETLINLVDKYEGITIIPRFATIHLSPAQKKKIKSFTRPAPVREICLVTHRDFIRKKITDALVKEIMAVVPFKDEAQKQVVIDL